MASENFKAPLSDTLDGSDPVDITRYVPMSERCICGGNATWLGNVQVCDRKVCIFYRDQSDRDDIARAEFLKLYAPPSGEATLAARARILRAVDRVGAYTLSDDQREAIRKASQGHYPDGTPFEDYCP